VAKLSTGTGGDNDSQELESVMKIPKMPPLIKALLHQDYNKFDPEAQEMLSKMKKNPALMEFGHARDNFYNHLVGTFALLGAWGQPSVIQRCGLMHTAYSGDLFQFYAFKADCDQDRAKVRSVLGKEGEALTWLFGTINRAKLWGTGNIIDRSSDEVVVNTEKIITDHRLAGEGWEMSVKDTANILMVTLADYLDQMVDMNAWRDHHQCESADVLYPGDGKPAIAMYWLSTVAKGIAPYLDVTPPIFDSCTKTITYRDEVAARDLYWKVVVHESTLDIQEQIDLLQQAVELNPFVGEPRILLAQLYFRLGDFCRAAEEAQTALEKFYQLATAWDKRRSFECWVGFSRVILMRSQRAYCLGPKSQMPHKEGVVKNAKGYDLVDINELLKECVSPTCADQQVITN